MILTPLFIQARSKIKVDVSTTLFNNFNQKTHSDSYIKVIYLSLFMVVNCLSIMKLLHLFVIVELTDRTNASYDLLEHTYDDIVIRGQT